MHDCFRQKLLQCITWRFHKRFNIKTEFGTVFRTVLNVKPDLVDVAPFRAVNEHSAFRFSYSGHERVLIESTRHRQVSSDHAVL